MLHRYELISTFNIDIGKLYSMLRALEDRHTLPLSFSAKMLMVDSVAHWHSFATFVSLLQLYYL
jgi:hypothetical protein